jgi:hypothetical protein
MKIQNQELSKSSRDSKGIHAFVSTKMSTGARRESDVRSHVITPCSSQGAVKKQEKQKSPQTVINCVKLRARRDGRHSNALRKSLESRAAFKRNAALIFRVATDMQPVCGLTCKGSGLVCTA